MRAISAGFRNRTCPHRPARRQATVITEIVQLDKMQVLQLLKRLQSDELVTIAIYDMDPREKRIGLEKARKRRSNGRKSRP